MSQRPPYLVSSDEVPEEVGRYPDSDEELSFGRAIGRAAGLERIGVHIERLPPGHRTSFPHAEADEEEFVYVLEGSVDAWVDGEIYPMKAGDFIGFVAGTGISHTIINNSAEEARLLVGGEKGKPEHRIFYPLNPERRGQLKGEQWWDDVPRRPMGGASAMGRKR